jgi:hypothetical protein
MRTVSGASVERAGAMGGCAVSGSFAALRMTAKTNNNGKSNSNDTAKTNNNNGNSNDHGEIQGATSGQRVRLLVPSVEMTCLRGIIVVGRRRIAQAT